MKSILVRDLYGLKSAREAFQNHLEDCMHYLGLLPYPAKLDLWMNPMVRPDSRFNYYAYVLIHVDDAMVIHHDADGLLRIIDKYFNLKPILIGDTDIYLGAKLKKMRLENGVWEWSNRPSRYAKESVENVEKYLAELADACWHFPKNKSENPFVGDYAPEMYKTPTL